MVGATLNAGAVPSPCIGICRLDAQELCVGCGRTLDEIAEWPLASETRRQEIMRELAGRRVGEPHLPFVPWVP